jgi:uncharacterized protein with HEPN domain
MTCYLRNISHIFEELGIDVTREKKRGIDMAIHEMLGVDYKNCSTVWKEVKKRLAEDEKRFMASLSDALANP